MLDIKWIRENEHDAIEALRKRYIETPENVIKEIIELDESIRNNIQVLQKLQHAKNQKTKMMGFLHNTSGASQRSLHTNIEDIDKKIAEIKADSRDMDRLNEILNSLPNILDQDVPNGKNENENQVIKEHGDVTNKSTVPHFKIGESLNMINFKKAVAMSGTRFVMLTRDVARLARALQNFMLDCNTKRGFIEVDPPYLVLDQAMYGSGQLPKFSEDTFKVDNKYRLIPTSEVSLVNIVSDTIVPLKSLPLRFVSYTPCFRSEAGSAGKDTRGMIRLHQFRKVELVSITTPENSEEEHEYMLETSESILQKLKLPYKVVLLCSGDTGFCARKTYDIEVWLPGQGKYREIASISNCGDFQSRRLNGKYKAKQNDNKLVHALNGSALPIERTIAAILENYYNEEDGSVTVPDVLIPYMDNKTKILPHDEYI